MCSVKLYTFVLPGSVSEGAEPLRLVQTVENVDGPVDVSCTGCSAPMRSHGFGEGFLLVLALHVPCLPM